MRKKTNVILICLLVAAALSASFITVEQHKRIRMLENSLPFLPAGEKIGYFDLIDKNDKKVDKTTIADNKVTLIFVFERPCSPCNKNIVFWNKIALRFKDQVNIYGVIAEDFQDFYNQLESLRVGFQLYCPDNVEMFLNELRIRTNMAQTILYAKGVQYLKLGELGNKDIFSLIEKIEEEIKKNG